MKRRLLHNLKSRQGFVLVFAMLMIMLLMVFMTAMVTTVGYTNRATAKKSDDQQLQLSAQSAIETLATELEQPENIGKLTQLATGGASQKYDLSSAGIYEDILAELSTDPSHPGYALLKVTASKNGKSYTLTRYIAMKSNLGPKNDLIENMIVAYWPNGASNGFTTEQDYGNVVMDGSVIIDNEYYKDGYGNSRNSGIEYGKQDVYGNKFFNNISADKTAVRIKGGTFKELVTTGNLCLTGEVDGLSHEEDGSATTTIATAVGQLYINEAVIGEHVKEIGAGGYFQNKSASGDAGNKKTGNVQLNNVEFKGGNADVLSRDSVGVKATNIKGALNNFFIGGKFDLTVRRAEALNVGNDLRGYKDVNITMSPMSQLDIGTDIAAGDSANITASAGNNSGEQAKIHVGDSIVSAREAVKIQNNVEIKADSVLTGSDLTIGSDVDLELGENNENENSDYVVFSGGNYANSGKFYESTKDKRGKTTIDADLDDNKIVINNKKIRANGVDADDIFDFSTAEGVSAFKTMNSLWLSKAQKVTKGGVWGSSDIRFAVSLLLEHDLRNGRSASVFSSSAAYNPKVMKPTAEEREAEYQKNYRWYEDTKETIFGGSYMPVSHELMYTTKDSVFMLRNQLRSALGGSSSSIDLITDGDYQGRFVETARTAIPYDGAIEDIKIEYPKVNGGWGSSLETTASAPIEPYKDGYLIGNNSMNYGYIVFKDKDNIFDAATNTLIPITGKTLYFKVTDPEIPNGAGDFILTTQNPEGQAIQLNNKIVVEYELQNMDAASIEKLSCVRFFVPKNNIVEIMGGFEIEGYNTAGFANFGRDNVDTLVNNFYYEKIQPEVYFFFMRPDSENFVSMRVAEESHKPINAFIIAPWSVIDMNTYNSAKDEVVFNGVILCKDLAAARGGTYKHYKPLAFGYAMSDDVFKLPSEDDAP